MINEDGHQHPLRLFDVQYIPDAPLNIFGIRDIIKGGGKQLRNSILTGDGVEVCGTDDDGFINLPVKTANMTLSASAYASLGLWHRRLGHLSLENVKKTAKLVSGMQIEGDEDISNCKGCHLGQPIQKGGKPTKGRKKAKHAFDRVHLDTFYITPTGYNGHKYGIIFTDEATSARWCYTFKKKLQGFEVVMDFI